MKPSLRHRTCCASCLVDEKIPENMVCRKMAKSLFSFAIENIAESGVSLPGLANHYWSRLRFSSYFISHFSFRDIGVELKCDVSRAQPMVERKSIWKSHKILNDAISLHFSAAVEQSIYLSKRNIQTQLNALHRECGAKRLRIQCWYVRRCCCGWESMLHTYKKCCWKHDLIFKVLVSIKSFTFYDFLYDDVWCHAALTLSLSQTPALSSRPIFIFYLSSSLRVSSVSLNKTHDRR